MIELVNAYRGELVRANQKLMMASLAASCLAVQVAVGEFQTDQKWAGAFSVASALVLVAVAIVAWREMREYKGPIGDSGWTIKRT